MGLFDGGGGNVFGDVVNTAGSLGAGGFGVLGQQLFGMNNQQALASMGIGPQQQFNATAVPGSIEQILAARVRQQQNYDNQNALAQALLAQSLGQGPSVAQNQLAQATGQNVANQAALMASQRGASANPALMARQAANVGAMAQQQGAGQAATLRAQEQLAAQQALMQQQAEMGRTALQQEAINQQGIASLNNAQAQAMAGREQRQGQMLGGAISGLGALAMMANSGGFVPGKEVVKGDSPKNDVVPILASPGEVVIPKSIMESPDMENKAIEFLKHLKKKKGGYEAVAKYRGGRC